MADFFTEEWTIGRFEGTSQMQIFNCLPTSPNSPNSFHFRVKHPMHHMLELHRPCVVQGREISFATARGVTEGFRLARY